MSDTDSRNSESDIDIPITVSENHGIWIADSAPLSHTNKLPPMARIIAIEGNPIKGMSIDEVRALLRGPVGSKASIELRTFQDRPINVIYERHAVKNRRPEPEPAYLLWQASNLLDSYDEYDVPSKYQSVASSCERAGFEPFSSALSFAALRVSEHWFESNNLVELSALIQAASNFDEVGRIDDADQALSKAANAAKKIDRYNSWELHIMLAFLRQLTRSGRNELASEVFKNLIVRLEESGGPEERTIRALRQYGNFLVSVGDLKQAEIQFDRIVELAAHPTLYNELLVAADFYVEINAFDRAIRCYQNFIRADKIRSSEMKRPFFQDSPLLHAIYKLACAQEKASHLDAAKNSLKEAASFYTTRIDEAAQVQMERVPLFFPALSDIEVKLAHLFLATGDTDSAFKWLSSAIARIEIALGPEARSLRKPLFLLSEIHAHRGDTTEAAVFELRANSLNAYREFVIEEKTDQYQTIRRGFYAIKYHNDTVAFEVFDELLDIFRITSNAERQIRASMQAWNCLSNFGMFLVDEKNFQSANKLFGKMIEAHSSKGASPVILNAIRTEMAIFSETLGTPFEESWQELENYLLFRDAKLTKSTKVTGKDVPNYGLALSERIRRWALAYYHCGAVNRASAILSRAEHHTRSSVSADAHQPGIDQNQSLFADIALTEINSGNFDMARKSTERALNQIEHLPSVKLLQLAATYEGAGKSTDAKILLLKGIESDINLVETNSLGAYFIPQAFYHWNLARLYANQGNAEEAGKFIDEAMNFYKTTRPPPPVPLSVFAGDLSCILNNRGKGVRYYLSAIEHCGSFGSSVFGSDCYVGVKLQILERAFAAQKTADDLSAEERGLVVKQLADSVADKDWERAVSLYQSALLLFPETSKTCVEIAHSLSMLSLRLKAGEEQSIETKKESALVAENSDSPGTYYLWLQLADCEVSVGKIEHGIEHIRHAFKQYSKRGRQFSSSNFHALLSIKTGAVLRLAENPETAAQAEALLCEAAKMVSTSHGADSFEHMASLVELARFYYDQRQHTRAAFAVDTVIANYSQHDAQVLGQFHQSIHPVIQQIFEISNSLAKRGDLHEAVSLNLRILSIQREKLPSNNIQIADTLFTLGSIYRDAKMFAKAASCYREAIQIKTEHYGNGRVLSHWIGEYAPVLRKLGRSEEAHVLETIRIDGSDSEQSVSSYVSKLQSDARRFESKSDFDSAHRHFLEAYELARQEIPFGHTAVHALEQLCDFYVHRKNFESASQVCKRLIDMYDAGARPGRGVRFKYVSMFVHIQLDKGQTEGLAVLINKARMFDLSFYSAQPAPMLLSYAELEIEAGLIDLAEKDLAATEQCLFENAEKMKSAFDTYTHKLLKLWRRLGKDARADSLINKIDLFKLSSSVPNMSPPSMGSVSSAERIELETYVRQMEKRIESCWIQTNQKEIRVNVRIDLEGGLVAVSLERSSGNAQADIAAVRAIQNAAPFPQLPNGVGTPLKLQFKFDTQQVSGQILEN